MTWSKINHTLIFIFKVGWFVPKWNALIKTCELFISVLHQCTFRIRQTSANYKQNASISVLGVNSNRILDSSTTGKNLRKKSWLLKIVRIILCKYCSILSVIHVYVWTVVYWLKKTYPSNYETSNQILQIIRIK